MKAEKKQYFIIIYYALLLLILTSRQTATTAPPMVTRIAFMVAALLPTILSKQLCYPAILTMFFTITLDGYNYSFFPSTLSLYVFMTLAITLLYFRKFRTGTIPIFVLLFAFYTFVIDLILGAAGRGSAIFQSTFYCFVLMGCFLVTCSQNIKIALLQLPLCFATTTIVLSIAYLTHRELFILQVIDDMERTGWTDPNYFGVAIGMGTIMGLIKLFGDNVKSLSIVEIAIYIAAVVTSVPTLAINASRGALLSVAVGFVILLLFSKAKLVYKIAFSLIAAYAVIYLYNNQYFDLLEYRIINDAGTGSGRTRIWKSKLAEYSEGNLTNAIFGYGHVGGANIGGIHKGFHNDYIGFMVDYGLIGLGFLLYMLLYPIRIIPKGSKDRPSVIVLIVYLSMSMVTLEPLLTGSMGYFTFYSYALLLAKNSKQNTCRQ